MRQGAVKEQHRRGTQTKIVHFSTHGLNNSNDVGYSKRFKNWCENLHFYDE
jgi:CHAT domain-containing protein